MSCGEIAALIVAGITAIGVFAGPMLAAWWRRRKERQDRKLREHFEELKSKVVDPMMDVACHLTERYGKLEIFEAVANVLSYSSFTSSFDFEAGEQFESFVIHFSDLATEWQELKGNINKHNSKQDCFKQEIEQAFTRFPHISAIDFRQFFNRWKEIANNRHPRPDFKQIESRPTEEVYALYASGWNASPVAMVSIQGDVEECKQALVEMAENKEYQDKAARIHVSALNLVEELGEFAGDMDKTIGNISRYLPSNRFTTLESCPICQKF